MNTRTIASKALFCAATAGLVIAAGTPARAQATYDHLKCVKIKDTKTFKKATADVTVAAGHLAGLANCQISAGAKEFCAPVRKASVAVEEGFETPLTGQDLQYDRLCYKLKCPATEPGPQAYMDQFDTRTIDGFKVATICTPAVLGPVPAQSPPVWPADPNDYPAGPSSYFDTLTIPSVSGGVPTCCKDFGAQSKDKIEGGTNNIDNALAMIADGLSGLGIDVQGTLDSAIQDGDLVLLLDHQNLDALSLPDPFSLVQFVGAFDVGTDYTLASAGAGSFLVNESSFASGTGEPQNWTSAANMDTSDMAAGPFTASLSLPFGLFSLDVSAERAEIIADHGAITPGGVPYSNGELSGYVLIDDIYANLNVVLNSDTCTCLNLTEDVYQKGGDGLWFSDCVSNASTLCDQAGEEVCVTLAGSNLLGSPPQVCGALPELLGSQADIDINSDPTVYEGLSIGLQFTAVNAQITGVQP